MSLRSAARALIRSAGARDGLIMVSAVFIAGMFDYLANVVIGRMLSPADFGVFVAVTALLQVMVYLTNVIRNVVAFYTAELAVREDAFGHISAFLQDRWRWAWRTACRICGMGTFPGGKFCRPTVYHLGNLLSINPILFQSMTGSLNTIGQVYQPGNFSLATFLYKAAAGVEDASRRQIDGTGDTAG